MSEILVSDNDESIDTEIEESLDLSDLDDVDSAIEDLDKSLSSIDINESLKEPSTGDNDALADADIDATGEYDLEAIDANNVEGYMSSEMDATGEINTEGLNEGSQSDEAEEIKGEIDDFDPLEASVDEPDDVNDFELPDFSDTENLSSILSSFETYSIENLNASLKMLDPVLFSDNGDYVRSKRKIKSILKKKEDEIKEKEKEEKERIELEKEQENNILPIDKLIKTAVETTEEIELENVSKSSRFSQITANKLKDFKNSLSKIKVPAKTAHSEKEKINIEKLDEVKKNISLSINESKQVLADQLNTALKTKAFSTGLLVAIEVLKTTLPAIIVGLFVLELNKSSVEPNILESLISDDPSRVQIGLELIKTNVGKKDKSRYYDLAYKNIEDEINKSWDPSSSNKIIERSSFIMNLKRLSFSDGDFNLAAKIKEKIKANKKIMSINYQAFYNTEINELKKDNKFIQTIREANIFLKNNKCLSALEKYILAERFNYLSRAANYGKTLALNCVSVDKDRAKVTQKLFELQARVDANLFLKDLSKGRIPASD